MGIPETVEKTRVLPGLRAALLAEGPAVRGAAAWAAGRLGLARELADEIRPLTSDRTAVHLLIDGKIEEFPLAELAEEALSAA